MNPRDTRTPHHSWVGVCQRSMTVYDRSNISERKFEQGHVEEVLASPTLDR
jgi:hypothetical protein